MIHTNADFSQRVEDTVVEVESRTDAEVVIVAAGQSGQYIDAAMLWASVVSLAMLVAAMLVPAVIHPALLVINLAITWAVCVWLFNGPWFLRFAVSKKRQKRQVTEAAAAEFHLEAVHSTPNRTGLLIYISALEGKVELIADVGLEQKIPQGAWVTASEAFRHNDLNHFIEGLKNVGKTLAEHIPPTGDETFDLPNAPRVR
jgi:putative membrane protein